jgi:hypothetical protein
VITHSAGDVEDYPLFAHAPSIAVHFHQADNLNLPWPLWKMKSRFVGDALPLGAVKAKKISELFYFVAFACFNPDGTLNETVTVSGLNTIFKRAAQLDAMVYFQYRSRSFPEPVRSFISGYAGAVACYLTKADNKARQNVVP